MSKVTKATFTDRLTSAVHSDNSLAAEIQSLIVYSREFYKAHGSCARFDDLMNANFRASRKEAIKLYITAHSNVKLSKTEDDKFKFASSSKSDVKQRCIALPEKDGVTITWHEFSKEPVTLDYDIDAKVKALIKSCETAVSDGKKLKGTKAHTVEVLAALKLVAA